MSDSSALSISEQQNAGQQIPEVKAISKWRAYYDITKPRVVALLVLTAVVGMSLSVPGG